MRAFITGVTGFAGSHLAEYLLSYGDLVLGCSHNARWPAGLPAAHPRGVSLFAWDLADGVTVEVQQHVQAFQPEVVFHLAAISVPWDCGEAEPTPRAIHVNVDGTSAVVELCRALDPPPKLLFASSCYVYAPVSPTAAVVHEDAPLGPTGAYGKTKLAAEQRVLEAARMEGIPSVVARSFQHTGPRQSERMILPDWSRQVVRPGDKPIRAICLDTYLDLSDVRDVVRAYRALALDGIAGTVYNVGSGVSRRSGDLLETMQRCAGSRHQVIEREPGIRQHPIADISRLQQATGWKPEIPLEQTIIDTLNYWREQGRTA